MVINISGHSYGIFNSASPVVWLPPTFLRIRFIIDNGNGLKLRKFLVNFNNCSHLIFNYILNIQSIAWELVQSYLNKLWGSEQIPTFLVHWNKVKRQWNRAIKRIDTIADMVQQTETEFGEVRMATGTTRTTKLLKSKKML